MVAASLSGVAASTAARPSASATTATATAAVSVEAAPLRTIRGGAGTKSDLWNPGQVAAGPGGVLITVNEGDYHGDVTGWSITVHAGGADGDVAPLRRIRGEDTGLEKPTGVDIDRDGRIYVADAATDSISVFAPGANGNAEPERTILGDLTELDGPAGLDVQRNRLAVANRGDGSVLVFDREAQGNAKPERKIEGDRTGIDVPSRIALAPDGELIVGTWTGKVLRFAPGAGGDWQPTTTLTLGQSVTGLALGTEGHLYVASQMQSDSHAPVQVFAPGATRPSVRLAGDFHDLDMPRGLALRPNRQVVVTDETDDQIHTFADLLGDVKPTVRKPGKVRALKVAGGPRKARRAVTWRKPAATGGAKVTKYRVVVKKGKKKALKRVVKKRRVVLRRGQLPKGRLVVRVQARNSQGFGKATTKRFRVR